MSTETTERGFAFVKFNDMNGVACKIQKSSIATDDAIWFGAEKIGLQEFVAFRQPAWQEVELEQNERHHYIANNSMHLSRDQLRELLPILQRFVETGEVLSGESVPRCSLCGEHHKSYSYEGLGMDIRTCPKVEPNIIIGLPSK